MGNFSSITTNGNTQTRTHNQQNEITAVSGLTTPTYDANGNLTKDEQGQTYSYDAWNRLVQVKNSGNTVIASYKYDALGRRIQETHSGTVNDLYYSAAWQVLEERTGVSTATIQYVWSPVYVDALVLRDRSTQNNGTLDERLWVQQDANWNVTALVNNSGSVVERYIYDPYGQVTYLNASFGTITGSAYAWIYGFQGLRLDTATGNDDERGRQYRPPIARFLQNDPIGIQGGDTNFYRDEGNNPTGSSDPSGMDEVSGEYKDRLKNMTVQELEKEIAEKKQSWKTAHPTYANLVWSYAQAAQAELQKRTATSPMAPPAGSPACRSFGPQVGAGDLRAADEAWRRRDEEQRQQDMLQSFMAKTRITMDPTAGVNWDAVERDRLRADEEARKRWEAMSQTDKLILMAEEELLFALVLAEFGILAKAGRGVAGVTGFRDCSKSPMPNFGDSSKSGCFRA